MLFSSFFSPSIMTQLCQDVSVHQALHLAWRALLSLGWRCRNKNLIPTMTLIQSRISYQPERRLQGPRKNTGQPVSCDKFSRVDQLNILQVNISGFSTKSFELMKMLNEENIHVALIEETILPTHLKNPGNDTSHRLGTTGYTPFQCKCQKCQPS